MTTYTHILDLAKEAEPTVNGILSRTVFQDGADGPVRDRAGAARTRSAVEADHRRLRRDPWRVPGARAAVHVGNALVGSVVSPVLLSLSESEICSTLIGHFYVREKRPAITHCQLVSEANRRTVLPTVTNAKS